MMIQRSSLCFGVAYTMNITAPLKLRPERLPSGLAVVLLK